MYNIKEIKISNLINDTSFYINRMLDLEDEWLDQRVISTSQEFSQQYQEICQQHHLEHKWILMINPEDSSLEELSKSDAIDAQKILRVNTEENKLNVEHIEMALKKGNCSAIIVSNAHLNEQQITQLSKSAQRGKTQCIVINQNTLH